MLGAEGERPRDGAGERRGRVGRGFGERHEVVVEDAGRRLGRDAACEHPVERRADGVEIGPRPEAPVRRILLVGRVARFEDDRCRRAPVGGLGDAGGAEVEEHDVARARQVDVVRVDVAVDDAVGVEFAEREEDRADDALGGGPVDAAAAAFEVERERRTVEVVHHQIRRAVGLEVGPHADDVRVPVAREQSCLLQKARASGGEARRVVARVRQDGEAVGGAPGVGAREELLDGDLHAEARVEGAVGDAEAAGLAEDALDLVLPAEHGARREENAVVHRSGARGKGGSGAGTPGDGKRCRREDRGLGMGMHPTGRTPRRRAPAPGRRAADLPGGSPRSGAMPLSTRTRRIVRIATISIAATLLVTLIALNVTAGEHRIKEQIQTPYRVEDPRFVYEMSLLLGPPVIGGNAVTALDNGDEIFPAMLAAIDSARTTITFETYIYWSGEIGDRFSEALERKAREGVRVHVLVDWAGAIKMDEDTFDAMTEAGVEVARYRPLKWYQLSRMNSRTHRKLLVVDGRVGFTGGVGIADLWSGHAQDPEHWRDMHFRVEGPVVAQLQAAFLDNWIQTTGSVLNGEDYFPRLDADGAVDAHVFTSSPDGGSDSMRLMYLMAITSAARTVDLASAYFVPDELTVEAIVAARERGVIVRVLVPGPHIDSELVEISSKRIWGDLLAAGVEISVYQPTMLHTKMLVVDGFMTSVGSTNFDVRSFELNDEASINLYDTAFAAAMTATFERDWADGEPYTLAMWKERPWTQKFAEAVLIPLESQL